MNPVPRNVLSLVPRTFALPTPANRRTRRLVEERLAERCRLRRLPDHIALDFPKRLGHEQARAQVVADLDAIDPRWSRVFVLYPRPDT
jgi:hypothetical protein